MPAARRRRGVIRSFLPLVPHVRRNAPALAGGLASIVGMALFSSYVPWVMRAAIDELGHRPSPLLLRDYALLLLSLTVLQGALRYLMRRLLIGCSREIEYGLRGDLFSHILRLDAAFFDRWRTGDLMSRLSNDLSAVRMALGPGVMNVFSTGATLLFTLFMMLRIDMRLTLYTLAPFPLMSVLVLVIGRRVHRRFTAVQALNSEMSAAVQENLSGIRVVKAYGMEEREIRRFGAMSGLFRDRSIGLEKLSGLSLPVIQSVTGATIIMLVWVGGSYVVDGHITIGDFVAFMAYLAMLVWPMAALGWVGNLFQRGAASMDRINEILEARSAVVDAPAHGREIPPAPEVRFEGVGFSYGGAKVLGGVTLVVRSGEVLGIVGPTGAGKSTLLKLLLRLYDPTEGRILVAGADARDIALTELREKIGYAAQEPFLLSMSVGDNFGLGRDSVTPDELWAAAAAAAFREDVSAMPAQFETQVGERGIMLSGGQKQKTALARAFLKNPHVLLLDDPFSSMDTASASTALSAVRARSAGTTTLIVSHRVAQVSWADRIVVIENGAVTAQGTHAELIETSLFYARLCRKQSLLDEIESSSPDMAAGNGHNGVFCARENR